MALFSPPPLPPQRRPPPPPSVQAAATSGSVAFSGSGDLAGPAAALSTGIGALTGSGDIAGAGSSAVGSGAFTGSGAIAGTSVTSGVGVLTGSGDMSAAGARLVAGAGAFTGSGALLATSSALFPVAVHATGRYLVRPDGSPFLLCADTSWSLFQDIPLTSLSTYFGTLVSQGFNAVSTNAIEHHYTTVKPPKERGGLLPFTQTMNGSTFIGSPNGTTGAAGTQGQFGADNYSNINNQAPDCTFINNSYWLACEQVLDAAQANGIIVLIWPGYLGFHNNDEGWLNEMVVWDAVTGAGGFTGQTFANPAKSKMWNYGAWMAARWANRPNIIWVLGGDYGSNGQTLNTAQASAVSNLMAGLKSVASQQSLLYTAHWDRPAISTDTVLAAGAFDLNGCYGDEAVAELARRGYAHSPTKPTIGLEYYYENDLFGGSAPYRKYLYWQYLGGIAGGFYGEEQIWRFDDGTPGTDWTTLLATQARLDAARQFALWKTLPWHRLKPSGLGGMTSLITAGGGTSSPQSTDYVAAAATPEGDLLIAYIPPDHTGTITVAMTAMAASARARWFDPTNATFASIGVIANTGTHVFTTPATNSAGQTDFLLVLDTPAGAFTGSGDTAATGRSLASTPGALAGSAAIAATGASMAAGSGALTGSGAIAAAGAQAIQGTGSLSGAGAFAATGTALATGLSALAGAVTLAPAPAAVASAPGALSGVGALAGHGAELAAGAASLSGAGDISSAGSSPAPVVGAFTGSGSIVGAGAGASAGTGTGGLTGAGALVGAGAQRIAAVGDVAGAASLTGAGGALVPGHGVVDGTGALAGAGTAQNAGAGVGVFAGAAALGAIGASRASGATGLAGTGAMVGAAPQLIIVRPRLLATLATNNQLTAMLQLLGVTVAVIDGPITIYQGDTAGFLITVTDDAGAPFNLTAATSIEVRVKETAGAPDPPLISKDLGNGVQLLDQVASPGKASITLGTTDTGIPAGRYALSIYVEAPGLRQHIIPPRDFVIAAVV